MSVERAHRTSSAVDVAAPAGVLYALVADTTHWPLFLADTVLVEQLDSDGTRDRFSRWTTADPGVPGGGLSLWRRTLDPLERRIDFRQEESGPLRSSGPSGASVTTASGSWSVSELAPGWSRLMLERETTATGNRGADADRALAAAELAARAELDRFRSAAERWSDLDGLLLSVEDSVRIPGDGEAAHAFLYRVGSWPGRVPHVVRAEVTEERPGVQRVSTVSVTGEGSAYTTESLRLCFPAAGRIVHKQTRPHPLLAAHTGEWSVVPDPAGVSLVSRHSVLLDERAVPRVLGPGADLAQARRYVRELLGRENEAVLALARQYAGEPVRGLRAV